MNPGMDIAGRDVVPNIRLKEMIVAWQPGKENKPSDLDRMEAATIAQIIQREFDAHAQILSPERGSRGRPIVAFLGNTSSGKSTLINFLASKRIIREEEYNTYILDPRYPDPDAMTIGDGGNSETVYPKSIDVWGLRLFDLPGFDDTKGSVQNLVNAALIKKIISEAGSVRLVFVALQSEFEGKHAAHAKEMFNCVSHLFDSDQGVNILDSGVLVVTKVTDCNPSAGITNFLLKKTNSPDKAGLHQQVQSWGERDAICGMFAASKEGNPNNESLREAILSRIGGMDPAQIRGINVSVLYPQNTRASLVRVFKPSVCIFRRKIYI
jgi:hypothetical protein